MHMEFGQFGVFPVPVLARPVLLGEADAGRLHGCRRIGELECMLIFSFRRYP
jgi:hypothetical protein